MKLSEIKGEHALDVLADLMDPIAEIAQDQMVVKLLRSNQKLTGVKILLKKHKKSVLNIMAILNEEDPKTYNPSLLTLPALVLEILNDPDLVDLFQSGEEVTSSGSPTENTEVEKK